ncbi:MAG: hypothetical protein CMM02_05325 [Rhodopirellula sp.]|jgi:hypothetical protein|nr:hypothetical protein [Rhodopirellula sp.]|tara:strand:- start:1389 stop:1595 length:207 start_codon:yes stop_codon:yes gene_type:complete
MNEKIHKVSDSGHSHADVGHQFKMDLTYKIRLKVLKGYWDPTPSEYQMIREYKKSGLSPAKFLKKYKN